jgi:hypothetical protein
MVGEVKGSFLFVLVFVFLESGVLLGIVSENCDQ